ncbi:MAG: phenylalanine--tRNA ligase subunit beta, partial [Chloroflexota bacterium]
RLALAMCGPRELPAWQGYDSAGMDFFDLKGLLFALFEALHLPDLRTEPAEHPTFHPGKCARLFSGDTALGVMGELHPLVREHYELPASALLAADLDLPAIMACAPSRYPVQSTPAYPPVLEDLAVIVDEDLPAERVEAVIRQAGGKALVGVRLFDLFRGGQIGAGKKSLAYSLSYQSSDKTLTDEEAAKIRQRIIRAIEKDLGAKIRS